MYDLGTTFPVCQHCQTPEVASSYRTLCSPQPDLCSSTPNTRDVTRSVSPMVRMDVSPTPTFESPPVTTPSVKAPHRHTHDGLHIDNKLDSPRVCSSDNADLGVAPRTKTTFFHFSNNFNKQSGGGGAGSDSREGVPHTFPIFTPHKSDGLGFNLDNSIQGLLSADIILSLAGPRDDSRARSLPLCLFLPSSLDRPNIPAQDLCRLQEDPAGIFLSLLLLFI